MSNPQNDFALIATKQLTKLDSLADQTKDINEICKIASVTSSLLHELKDMEKFKIPLNLEAVVDADDACNFNQICEFLKRRPHAIRNAIANDTTFPYHQPMGKNGKIYSSKKLLRIWNENQMLKTDKESEELKIVKKPAGHTWRVE